MQALSNVEILARALAKARANNPDWQPILQNRPEELIQMGHENMVLFNRGFAQAFWGEAPHIAEPHRATGGGDLFGACAAGVRGGHNRTGADAGNAVERDAVLLEHLEDADMGDAAGESAAQGQANPYRRLLRGKECRLRVLGNRNVRRLHIPSVL